MKNYNNIKEKEVIQKIEILEEYQKFCSEQSITDEIKYSELDKNFNIASLYLREIRNIPLLTEDEEIRLGNDLKLIDNLKIVTKKSKDDKYSCIKIDLPLVFKLCCNNQYYEIIIDSLLLHFQTNSHIFYKELYPIITKYKMISKEIGRALNEKELKEYFKIEDTNNIALSSKELLIQVKDYLKYKSAFDKMFYSNLRLVVNIANKHKRNNQLVELINEGNIGLIIAIRKFDVSLGYKFSTYATYWIKRAIRTFIINQRTMVRIPFYLNEEFSILRRDIFDLQQKSSDILTAEEISKELNVPIDKIKRYLKCEYDCNPLSLDLTVTEDGRYSVLEYVKDKVNIESDIMDLSLKQEITILYEILNERELQVIKMRFGLDEYNGETLVLKDVGMKLGVSIERVRQIESKAISKMRRLLDNQKYNALREYIK